MGLQVAPRGGGFKFAALAQRGERLAGRRTQQELPRPGKARGLRSVSRMDLCKSNNLVTDAWAALMPCYPALPYCRCLAELSRSPFSPAEAPARPPAEALELAQSRLEQALESYKYVRVVEPEQEVSGAVCCPGGCQNVRPSPTPGG